MVVMAEEIDGREGDDRRALVPHAERRIMRAGPNQCIEYNRHATDALRMCFLSHNHFALR
jgi:hypothetical protein